VNSSPLKNIYRQDVNTTCMHVCDVLIFEDKNADDLFSIIPLFFSTGTPRAFSN
jgi:hypothetical protein